MIEAQLAAFQADDGATAFGFASPVDPAPVRQSRQLPGHGQDRLPAGLSPARGALRAAWSRYQGEPVQLVLLVGPDLEVVTAYYVDAEAGRRHLADQRLRPRSQRADEAL